MRLSRGFRTFLRSLWVWVCAIPITAIIAIALSMWLVGCASVFEAPQPATEYINPTSTTPVLCQYIHNGDASLGVWLMRVPRNQCKDWTPI